MRRTLALLFLCSSVAFASSIDKALVRRIITTQNGTFRACYNDALKREGPSFEGRAVLHISVAGDGSVSQVAVDFPRSSDRFTTCLRDAALVLRFPKFGAGEPSTIAIHWPILFKPN